MHLSIVAYGTWGDVRPAIALGLGLKTAGYAVRLIVTRDFAPWVKDTGLEVHFLPINKFELMQGVSSKTSPLQTTLAIHQKIAPALIQAGQALISTVSDTDALLVNEWLLGIASGIAEVHQLRLLNLALQPHIQTRRMPIATMPTLPVWVPFRNGYNSLSYTLAYGLRWFSYVRSCNDLRVQSLNLPPLSFQEYLHLLERTPSITLISPQVMPPPEDWPHHHHLTGFLYYDHPDWRPPSRLKAFIRSGTAPVYVGFGSMHDTHPDKTTRLVLEALESARQRGVLYRGWAGLGQIGLPPTVYPLEYAPHTWLFPYMGAVVHHAGAGTSAAALRAGVSSVPIPHSGDQFFWARKLHQIGAAVRPLPRSRLSAVSLAERIHQAVVDSPLQSRAAELGARISQEDGLGRTVKAIRAALSQS